ncbi:MAG: Hint domain-containing protein [Vannielia sp.]|uniref:Hint domain-containing protein n=1 Tax=Vannielia sp. TaxID=2813045 RepID=UPI003B8C8C20
MISEVSRDVTPAAVIGTGTWQWSGTDSDGNSFSNVTGTGSYVQDEDGSVWFIPDTPPAATIESASASSTPAYSDTAGAVDGGAGNDVIDGRFVDAQGDETSGGDDTVLARGGADTVQTQAGNDTIYGGGGNDTIYAGSGDDIIEGGDGNDVIHADNAPTVAANEQLNWTDQGGNGTNVLGGFTQDTGTMNVTVSVTNDGNLTGASVSTTQQYVGGSGFNPNSALYLTGSTANGSNANPDETGTVTFEFNGQAGGGMTDEVEGLQFRINDIDDGGFNSWDDRVTIRAYDAEGNLVPVSFQVDGNDRIINGDTIDANSGSDNPNEADGSVLVTVAGPVHRVEVIYQNADSAAQAIWMTDMTYSTIPDNGVGDDVVMGGGGDDTIYAYEGDDDLYGGTGNDTIHGGGGDDTISGGAGNDVIHADDAGFTEETPVDETLHWVSEGGNNTSIINGFTQNTGTMDVTVSFLDDGNLASAATSTDTQYVGGQGYDAASALELRSVAGSGSAGSPSGTSTIVMDFAPTAGTGMSDEVQDVNFRINDVDVAGWQDVVTVLAYDADGNAVPVTLTIDGNDTASGPNTVIGGGGTNDTQSAQAGSVLVEIAGPVSRIEIIYENGGTDAQALWVTDVDFTTVPAAPGNDTVDGGTGDDEIYGYAGDDTLSGNAGNDTIDGGDGEDVIAGGTGDDVMTGGDGDDVFIIENDLGNDTITGGETGETFGDEIDATAVTDDLTVVFSAPEDGTIADGTSTASFAEIETVRLGAGDDSVTGSTGDDYIETGAGADTVAMGAGNDTVALGAGDGAADTVAMSDGDGEDTVFDFEAPTPNGDGTFTGLDQIDVSGMTDAGGDPVSVHDVVVSDDGLGSAVLTFPNGETLTLVGISAAEAGDPNWLIAAGIPGDGIVSGTAGDDIIDASYADDPHGDVVDGGDAILPGEAPNDDIIEAGAGNDTIYAGLGDDEVYGEAGDDTFMLEDGFGADQIFGGETAETNGDTLSAVLVSGDQTVAFSGAETGTISDGTDTASFAEIENVVTGAGNDTVTGDTGDQTVFTGAGNDSIALGTGADTIFAGEGDDVIVLGEAFGSDQITGGEGGETAGDLLDAGGMTSGVAVTFTGDESGTVTQGANAAVFSEIERVVTGSGNDIVNSTAATGGVDVDTGAGDDTVTLGSGDDTLDAGTGNDIVSVYNGFGNDSLLGGEGGETLVFGGLFVGDVLMANGLSDDVTLTFTAPETGTISDGTDTLSFGEFESVTLGSGDDTVTGSTGADIFDTGRGSDTVEAGAGDDTYGLGSTGNWVTPDGDVDTIIFSDGDGNDTVHFFDAPTPNGDGTYTGIDQIDVSGMTDAEGNPVTVQDVVVSDDGAGNAVLAFPNGESLTLVGITPAAASDPFWQIAAGIPYDGIVEGTAGNDVIDGTYTGDPHGDVVDGQDNFNDPNQGLNDDVIHAGAGDDIIDAGLGDDLVLGEAGDDTFLISGDFENDTLVGGETGETNGDTLDTTGVTAGSMSITLSGDEAGTLTHTNGSVVFSEIENITTGGTDDLIDASATTGGVNLNTGAGDDGVIGGAGDDVVVTGEGSDNFRVSDGFGNDSFIAGEDAGGGDADLLWASDVTADLTVDMSATPESGTLTDGTNTVTFSEVELVVTGSGDDTVTGSSGGDTFFTGAGEDTIAAGTGDDGINAGDGDDRIVLEDGFGNDVIVGGEGGETAGDTLDASAVTSGVTVTFSDSEAGTLSDGTDTATFSEIENFVTGAGDDTIDGTAATEGFTADAGAGSDTLTGGAGADTLLGGDDADTFYAGPGDHVQGGEGGFDDDVLDLTGAGPTRVIYNEGDPESGTVQFLDGAGNVTDTMTFSEIETVNFIPCFTPGTMIATPEGPRPVEQLGPGDRVLTRDHGVKRLEWVGQRLLNTHHLAANPRLQPVLIKAGALGYDLPERDILVSPQHKMLISDARAEMLFGEHEVLVSAVHLVGLPGIEQVEMDEVVYVHVMFDAHEIIMAEGAWTESYQPGAHVLGEMEDEQREEIFEIFPELREDANSVITARMALKKREVTALFH